MRQLPIFQIRSDLYARDNGIQPCLASFSVLSFRGCAFKLQIRAFLAAFRQQKLEFTSYLGPSEPKLSLFQRLLYNRTYISIANSTHGDRGPPHGHWYRRKAVWIRLNVFVRQPHRVKLLINKLKLP